MNNVLRRYQTVKTHFASDFGPVNLSGIQFDLGENIEQAEAELNELAPELHELNARLRKALDAVPFGSTTGRNRDQAVVDIMREMHTMSFDTDKLNRVANHPLPGLMISYMAQLAGVWSRDPFADTRYSEMVTKLDARIAELEALETA